MAIKKNNDGFLPADTGRSLPMALLRAREVVMERFRPILSRHNITEQQWRVLRVLSETDHMEASQVARRACILAPSLTRIIKKLKSDAYITSRRDRRDGRRTLLAIDIKGKALIKKVAPESSAIYARIEAACGHDEIDELLNNLNHLQQSLRKSSRQT